MDICKLLGDRSDRSFAGRPGNLYAVFGSHARLIYMADDLSLKSSLLTGSIVEWRPDYVQLTSGSLAGPEGQALKDVSSAKYGWIGPRDTLLVEHIFKNAAVTGQVVRITCDLKGVAEVNRVDGKITFQIAGGFPKSVMPQLAGVMAATHPLTYSNGLIMVDVTVPSGTSVTCVVSLALGPVLRDAECAVAAVCRADAREESTCYWNSMLTTGIPAFTCSDPFMEKLYYFRWWSLLNKLNIGGYGRWSKPLAREGTVGFNSLITYSGGPNTIDLRWMRSPEWAYGNIQSYYDNLNDGKLANHIYPDRLDGDTANSGPSMKGSVIEFPYHNFLVKALTDIYALHPDKEMLRRLWPTVKQATSLYDNELDADHDGLYETYPWSNITGQEWGARFLYFHPFDQLLSYGRKWRPRDDRDAAWQADTIGRCVLLSPGLKLARTAAEMNKQVEQGLQYRTETLDANCYAYADMKAMAVIAEILGVQKDRNRWAASAEKTRQQVITRLWDPETGFFYDRDGTTKERSLVKAPTGFYPFWAGIGGKEHLPVFKHLFNPAEFWTPFPMPTISMDYPKLAGLKDLGWVYWNWNNWPMTTCHVVDGVARAAKDLDSSLTSGAAEFMMKYTKVHFIDGNLKRPCVSEHFDPISGKPNAPHLDYAHSYYIDLIMRHVVGIEADPLSDEVLINPLDMGLDCFEARNVRVKGHDLTVAWKKGEFTVSVDGKVAATAVKLSLLKVRLGK
ncbi:MAG: trehalase family glycosidase [bacterium]